MIGELDMAQLWLKDGKTRVAFLLDADPIDLSTGRPLKVDSSEDMIGRDAIVMAAEDKHTWVLLGNSRGLRVNGFPTPGTRVLRHRDEIRVSQRGATIFFSTERLASIEALSTMAAVICPRCRQEIRSNTPAVRCPQCGIWHHENEEENLKCWTYAERCAICSQRTDLRAIYQWNPEAL